MTLIERLEEASGPDSLAVRIKAAIFCRSGHAYQWHCLGFPGDGRTCRRCGHNQSWAEYWKADHG